MSIKFTNLILLLTVKRQNNTGKDGNGKTVKL